MIALDETNHEFTYEAGGTTAILQFRRRTDRFVIMHTVVPPELGGQGVGGQLVSAALKYAAHEGLTVVPTCPFARAWLQSHPDAAAQTPIEWPDTPDAE